MIKVLVKYSEIALKGKNRGEFINKLVGNIQRSANRFDLSVKSIIKEQGRILVLYEEDIINGYDKIKSSLTKVYGIEYFTFIKKIEKSVEGIRDEARVILKGYKKKGVSKVSFKTKRADKSFELISPQVNAEMGEVAKELGLSIDYKNFEEQVFVEITYKNCYMYSEKIKSLGGLPIDAKKKILCLLSGGIDSPVAATQLMKRGCRVDFF